ncbi:MAG: hypothetical protein HYX94_05020 [Chloroflexi bacterium]|nr:hypothetical protein [Chloroflexota bacterium]
MTGLEYWRDLAIIVLALFFFVQTVVVIALVSILVKVAMDVRAKTDSILSTTQSTMQNISGTATFVGDKVASPLIKSISFAYGVRKGIGVLAGIGRKNGR